MQVTNRPLEGRYRNIVYASDHAWQRWYPDPFRSRRAVMLHAVNLGWTMADCRQEFLRADNPRSVLWTHGRDRRLLPAAEASKRLARDYQAAIGVVMNKLMPEFPGYTESNLNDYGPDHHVFQWLLDGRARKVTERVSAGYEAGYKAGYQDGRNDGYQPGFDNGYETRLGEELGGVPVAKETVRKIRAGMPKARKPRKLDTA
jgi:flagellar biosynthesis/type III secretory pathway protein FliH